MSDSILMGNLVTEAEVIQVPEVQFILIRPAVFRPCLTTGLALSFILVIRPVRKTCKE